MELDRIPIIGNLILKLVCFLQLFDLSASSAVPEKTAQTEPKITQIAKLAENPLKSDKRTKQMSMKIRSNQKVEENKPALKLDFTEEFNHP